MPKTEFIQRYLSILPCITVEYTDSREKPIVHPEYKDSQMITFINDDDVETKCVVPLSSLSFEKVRQIHFNCCCISFKANFDSNGFSDRFRHFPFTPAELQNMCDHNWMLMANTKSFIMYYEDGTCLKYGVKWGELSKDEFAQKISMYPPANVKVNNMDIEFGSHYLTYDKENHGIFRYTDENVSRARALFGL